MSRLLTVNTWHVTVHCAAQSPIGYNSTVNTVRASLVRHGFTFQPLPLRTLFTPEDRFVVNHDSAHAMLTWCLSSDLSSKVTVVQYHS